MKAYSKYIEAVTAQRKAKRDEGNIELPWLRSRAQNTASVGKS